MIKKLYNKIIEKVLKTTQKIIKNGGLKKMKENNEYERIIELYRKLSWFIIISIVGLIIFSILLK